MEKNFAKSPKLYDRPHANSEAAAIQAAKTYLKVYRFAEVRVGELVSADGISRRWAVELPGKISPNGSFCDSAERVGPGYKFVSKTKWSLK